ncbi:MAG: NADH-ubiquinone oxidoreductase-F iron-sulfur binding region domain-containing protein [Candidatus Symbiobacter sp.]|nr:NADH-ubiquinone oxidoreductase-F iron-sulfur binding region domain-containing protein [Candidatus Symbiobacter sp.]
MGVKIYLSLRDSASLSLAAGDVADALKSEAKKRGQEIAIIATGSRGIYWLEPIIEIDTPQGRVGFGPCSPQDVVSLFEAGCFANPASAQHKLSLGLIEELPWLKHQQRLTFDRCGKYDPLDVAEYERLGGFTGLKAAIGMAPETVIDQVKESGLRGRGGAGFPTGIKWKTVADAKTNRKNGQKYIVCNADEGDSGTFSDRMILEGDPLRLIEGMVIAGLAVGATVGFVYIRSEYRAARDIFDQAIAAATRRGWLGENIAGSGKKFRLYTRLGAGAYICGEETSLLESIEGKRGTIRYKPPLPAIQGLFGQPTVINNVISLATIPTILAKGAKYYRDFGMGRSQGTMPLQLGGNIKHGGLVEIAFGITLRQVIEDFGGGTATGRPIRAVQVGGPLGAYFPASMLDIAIDYEAFAAVKGMVGHGGIVVFDETVNLAKQARFAMEFCAIESCGKCTPCRIGSTRGVEVIDRLVAAPDVASHSAQKKLLTDLCGVMTDGSLCALGGLTPLPVMSALTHFPEDFAPGVKGAIPMAAE